MKTARKTAPIFWYTVFSHSTPGGTREDSMEPDRLA